jgi:SAM-dependent methyltransferase
MARAAQFAPELDARYLVADAADTTLPDACADGLLCVDAIQLMSRRHEVMREVARLLRPGANVVLTTWEHDVRLPDIAALFAGAGLRVVTVEKRPEWLERERVIFERARAEAPHHDDPGLTDLAEEAEVVLPMLAQTRRVIAVAVRD